MPSIRCIRSHTLAGSALYVPLLARQRLRSRSRAVLVSPSPESSAQDASSQQVSLQAGLAQSAVPMAAIRHKL